MFISSQRQVQTVLHVLNDREVRPRIGTAPNNTWDNEKRARGDAYCVLAAVRQNQHFRPAADPLPGGAGRPKFNQLEMVTTFTYRPSLVKIDARNFELS